MVAKPAASFNLIGAKTMSPKSLLTAAAGVVVGLIIYNKFVSKFV